MPLRWGNDQRRTQSGWMAFNYGSSSSNFNCRILRNDLVGYITSDGFSYDGYGYS